MGHPDVIAIVVGVLQEHCSVHGVITPETRLAEDLGLDSVGLLTLALEVENHYQLILGENPAHPPTTVGDIVALINERLNERAS